MVLNAEAKMCSQGSLHGHAFIFFKLYFKHKFILSLPAMPMAEWRDKTGICVKHPVTVIANCVS